MKPHEAERVKVKDGVLLTALVDNSDPTDIRMMGRRRNALVTPQPTVPDSEDS